MTAGPGARIVQPCVEQSNAMFITAVQALNILVAAGIQCATQICFMNACNLRSVQRKQRNAAEEMDTVFGFKFIKLISVYSYYDLF